MNVSMLLMSYSYCPLPVLMWLVDKGLGRLAHKMPRCKNTVNQDLSLSVFKGEQVEDVEAVNGKLPSLGGTESASLWGNLLFSAGPGEKQQEEFSREQSKGSLHGSRVQQGQRMENLLSGVAA